MTTKTCKPNPVAIKAFAKHLQRFGRRHHPRGYEVESWTVGGCAVFAKALRGWLGRYGSMRTLVRYGPLDGPKGVLDHIAVRVGPYYVDGAGAHDEDGLVDNALRYYESWGGPTPSPDEFLIRPTTSADFRRVDHPWCPKIAVSELQGKLVHEFGRDPKPWICPQPIRTGRK